MVGLCKEKEFLMSKTVLSAVALLAVSACTMGLQPSYTPMQRIANPASEFCVKQGGKVEIRQAADGSQYGMCHFPDGRVVEEWENFRQQLQP